LAAFNGVNLQHAKGGDPMTEERVKRKLSAILSADVVGYSRLMGEDEVSTVRTLEAYRKVMSDLIEQFRGRVVDSPGDNLLAEFSSVVDAVQCAVEIHEVIRAKNEELPEDRRMLFRIGVNLGDVIEEGDRIYGDGVNIAARLEGLAEAGGICISGSAHEQIKNKLALGYEYIGEHAVKNIAEPLKVYRVPMGPKTAPTKEGDEKKAKLKNRQWVALGVVGAIIVIIGALAIWNFYPRGPSIEPASVAPEQTSLVPDKKEAPKTIAVLPFENLSPDPDQDYFVAGLSEEILNSLTQIPGLGVTARTSSFALKGTDKTVPEIASILAVDHIIEGSVRKSGNTLRITAQLIRAADGLHLWSEEYDRELKDIFKIQEDIASNVADKLKLTLEAFQLLGGTENIKAYEKYLVAKGKLEDYRVDQALESINEAISLDPRFALAWTIKTQIITELWANNPAEQVPLELNNALNAASKAIELEPDLGQVHLNLGSIFRGKGEFAKAEKAYRKGLELTTASVDYVEYGLSWHYTSMGYLSKCYKLLEEIRRGDPLHQQLQAEYMLLSGYLGYMNRAEEEYQRGKAIFGDQWDWGEGFITYFRLGVKDNVSINDIPELPIFDPIWSIARENIEKPERGLEELHRLYSREDNLLSSNNLGVIALFAAYFGEPEFALNAIERANVLRSSGLYFIWSPVMTEVRQLPRFKEFVREIGLVDYWKEYGWPDLCRPVGDDDFECD
jgi:adenylate cyclase